jgi:pimeloyl-ACP methyl ester carboxylesterase
MSEERPLARLRTALEVAFEVSGPEDGIPVTLLHGFPDDPRTWDRTVLQLASAGYRTILPYAR